VDFYGIMERKNGVSLFYYKKREVVEKLGGEIRWRKE
jgi:hypothetical protein